MSPLERGPDFGFQGEFICLVPCVCRGFSNFGFLDGRPVLFTSHAQVLRKKEQIEIGVSYSNPWEIISSNVFYYIVCSKIPTAELSYVYIYGKSMLHVLELT